MAGLNPTTICADPSRLSCANHCDGSATGIYRFGGSKSCLGEHLSTIRLVTSCCCSISDHLPSGNSTDAIYAMIGFDASERKHDRSEHVGSRGPAGDV